MRSTILTAAALVLFSSAVMAQSTDTKNPPTGPAAQSDSMSKGDMTKDKMTKKKMSKSEKMKKTHAKM
jgi:pentapeptide MXKDX repeat protein